MDDSVFLEDWESGKEVLVHCWSKKQFEIGHTEEYEKNSFILPVLLHLQGSTAMC